MLQRGRVLRIEGAYALVHMERGAGCGRERCPLSSPLIDDSRSDFYTVRARNEICASPGDMVLVEVKDQVVLAIAFLLYIVPVLLTLATYASLRFLFPHEPVAVIGLFGSLGASFLLLRRCNKMLTLEYRIVDFADPQKCPECPLLVQSRR
ncbi:MAG: SoxR reducing system RseC family protein [Atribacterota bacterium]